MNKLDLIIDALKYSETNGLGWMQPHEDRHQAALTAARELRELQPVAWMSQGGDASRSANYFKEMGFTNLIALYALDEETK